MEQHTAGTLVGHRKDDVACKWIALRIAAAFLQHLRQGELAKSGEAQTFVGCGSSKRTHRELVEAVGWDRQVYDLAFTICRSLGLKDITRIWKGFIKNPNNQTILCKITRDKLSKQGIQGVPMKDHAASASRKTTTCPNCAERHGIRSDSKTSKGPEEERGGSSSVRPRHRRRHPHRGRPHSHPRLSCRRRSTGIDFN